ncbi:WD40-repeat-containing domain protein [Suillus ampliporus]|nr:WD40-repeat-containing domain protein [Suillus ampliporus]
MTEEAAYTTSPSTSPIQWFQDHEDSISAVAVFPDRRRMVTGSFDGTLRLWDLEKGVVLRYMGGHTYGVRAVAVARNGKLIASGGRRGGLITWNGDTGEPLINAVQAHSDSIDSLDFSPDGAVLATGSRDKTTILVTTSTWKKQQLIHCRDHVWCIRYSPSGEHLAIATSSNIQIWNPGRRDCIINLEGLGRNLSLTWTSSGTRLLSAGNDNAIQEWDSSSWKQVGDVWKGHTNDINAIVVDSTGTLVASASDDNHVRLWRLSDRRTIALFKHSGAVYSVTFSMDSKVILSGGGDKKISMWPVPADALPDQDTDAKAPWKEALREAQKVIELNPSFYLGYQLKHTALHDAERYDEAIEVFQTMLSKLDDTPNPQIQNLRQQYLSPSKVEGAIRMAVQTQLDNAPLRVVDTTTGLLCDREAQISTFKTSTEYKRLLSFTMKHPTLRTERIEEVVLTYFHYKVVYKLESVGGIRKLQLFCQLARAAGYRWAWSDTCCIDKSNNVELQESLTSMFACLVHWRQSAWNTRGWTVGEFLAPKVILFYQKDWSPYLGDHTANHKESVAIMQELEDATGIDRRALVAFCPGMTRAREKLQWASTRVTTLQEDIAYSLFGIFGIHLPVIYGEKKQNALGRLLQEIVAQSGDITALDWVGKSSEFNSCLPADITSYKALLYTPPSVSEDEMHASVSLMRNAGAGELASRLYQRVYDLVAPRFAHRRLHLACITFPVTEVRRRPSQDKETYFTYEVKADGLHDLLIATDDQLIQFSRSTRTFVLVRPWNRGLLELPDPTDDTLHAEDYFVPGPPGDDALVDSKSLSRASRFIARLGQPFRSFFRSRRRSPGENGPVGVESHSQALRFLVRLGQPFGAFLLVQQQGGEYKRIASDRNIIARVKDIASVRSMMDVRTLEIL